MPSATVSSARIARCRRRGALLARMFSMGVACIGGLRVVLAADVRSVGTRSTTGEVGENLGLGWADVYLVLRKFEVLDLFRPKNEKREMERRQRVYGALLLD